MPQLILDPSATKHHSKEWHPDGPLPQSTREFGYCIDFSALLPGDLVLFSSITPDITSWSIHKVQGKGGYGSHDACWDHAAIYIQSDTICHAIRSGVKIGSLFDYMETHKIRVRRNLSLSQDERWGLVVNALKQKDYSYGFLSILDLVLKAQNGFWKHTGNKLLSFPKRAIYCSELYADAHVKTCGVALVNLNSGEATPASLSCHPILKDVQVGWLKIN